MIEIKIDHKNNELYDISKNIQNNVFKARPFLKWVGGKKQIIPQIKQYIPRNYYRYFEPFIGGGALFFDLAPKKAYVNDINEILISVYRNIKFHPHKVVKKLEDLQKTFYAMNEKERKLYFYEIRNVFNEKEDSSLIKTTYLIFLNKTCFNGMYRENSKGQFNVPFGRYKNPKILDEKNILAVSKLLQKTTITNYSFEKAVKDAKEGDFIYFDPPYHPLTITSNFTNYSNGGFNKEDQMKLRDVCINLDKRNCFVMLSNSNTQFIREIYHGFNQKTVLAARIINCKASGRGKINELLIMNY
ncbi:MAG: DNA adenine methylase [Patescibacteria group bacterium]|nr:DNA adenine methylase [Patescibacteria group bacterium]